MASINFVWFDSARVSAVNEQQQRAIPLRTLVAASGTSAGSYDLFNLRDLLQGKTWRLFMFGLLTLLSAVSRTALSNVIAYEAYSEKIPTQSISLRLQRDLGIYGSFFSLDGSITSGDSMFTPTLYDFTASQNAKVSKEMVALLTELSFENTAPGLIEGTYVGINATSQSLSSLPLSIVELDNIPAYRLSIECAPDLPTGISVLQPLSRVNTQITLLMNATATFNNTLFKANYPGVP